MEAVIFIGMASTVLPLALGEEPRDLAASDYQDRFLTVAPPLFLMGLVLLFGLWLPASLTQLLNDAARLLEVKP